jgi:hypothetical protein
MVKSEPARLRHGTLGQLRKVYLFKRESWYEREVWVDAGRERKPDLLIVVAGGDSWPGGAMLEPYDLATNPVSKEVHSELLASP